MDDSSPLFMQFKQLDADGDNKLTTDQVYQLLKLLGKNIYKGSVINAARLVNYNVPQEQNTSLFNFQQFKQFYESLQNPLKNDIWKGKYKILEYVKDIRKQINDKEDKTTAAPGAGKTIPQDIPFRGDIQITVGPTNQNYNSFIQACVEKVPKGQSKPFVKLVFEQNTKQSAKQLQSKFKALQVKLFQLMKSSDPESAQILDYIHIITNVADTKLNVFVTTSNQALIELGAVAAYFLDQILGVKFSAKIELKHQFSIDINKFIDNTSNYSFYHALTKNYHTKLVWNAINVRQATKQLCKAIEVFSDFKHNKLDPTLLLLTTLLHTEICQARLVFDNAQINEVQTQSKNQILIQLASINQKIAQEQGLGILQTIAAFNNKIYIEASIGDWKAQANIQIQDLNKLFTQKVSNHQNEQSSQQNHDDDLITKAPKILDKLSNSGSQTSLKGKKVDKIQLQEKYPSSSQQS